MKVAVIHNRDREGVINVFGPQNRERYNPKTVERVAAALEQGGHSVRVIDGNMHLVEQLRDFMPRVLEGQRPGMVFNMAYGIQGVSRYTHLPAILEMLGVPYVGSNPMAHGLALDKVIAKIVFRDAGLPTPGFWNFASADDRFDDLVFPVIVKPKMEAVSYGIRVVDNEPDLRDAVKHIIDEFQQHVLVEQFIPGREFAVGLLGNGPPEVLPLVEIDLEGDPNAIQTAGDKLRKPRPKICPAELPEEKAEEMRSLVRRAFQSLELFDFARVDLRMDAEGNLYILEINSMASLGLTGAYVHAAKTAGYTYESLINRILDVAAMRYFGQDYVAEVAEQAAESKTKPQKLSTRVRSYLRAQAPTIEDSVRHLVELRTPPDEVEWVNALGEWLTTQFTPLGFSVRSIPRVGVGNVLYFYNHDDDERDVLLLGHLDTPIPAGGYVPYREAGSRVYGTGAAENKGGIAVALAALRALRYARTVRRIRCGVLLTTDDTRNGAAGRGVVEELAARARYVIGLKAGNPDGGIVTSRAGRGTYRLTTIYPKKRSVTEAVVLAHLYRRAKTMEELSESDAGLHVAIRRLELDAPFGRAPEKADAVVSVRFKRVEDGERIEREIRALAAKRSAKGLRLRAVGQIRRPPLAETPKRRAFFEEIARVGERLHVPVSATHRWHSADICFVPEEVPAIDGMGPLGGGERTQDEYILRSSLVDRAALLAMVMHRCAKGDEG
ncbi:MAG: M20/M25/M40 family metallo-hydrolase [Gemmatimonadota bacterium]|nr:MAG: M20/M25/M40 family metallo-hydrolase [Gemmatimonadota bacterium]